MRHNNNESVMFQSCRTIAKSPEKNLGALMMNVCHDANATFGCIVQAT